MKLDEVTTSVTSNSILASLFFLANHLITSIKLPNLSIVAYHHLPYKRKKQYICNKYFVGK